MRFSGKVLTTGLIAAGLLTAGCGGVVMLTPSAESHVTFRFNAVNSGSNARILAVQLTEYSVGAGQTARIRHVDKCYLGDYSTSPDNTATIKVQDDSGREVAVFSVKNEVKSECAKGDFDLTCDGTTCALATTTTGITVSKKEQKP